MSHSWLSINAICSMLLIAACDNAATEQSRAMGAQTEADNKIAAANNEAGRKATDAQIEATNKIVAASKEADQKTKDAQLEADQQLAVAKENFKKMREDYRHATQTKLIELDGKVAALETKGKKAAGKGQAELYAKVKQIHSRRDAFMSNYKALDTETAATWDDAKARLDKEWSELQVLVDNS